MRTRQRHHHFLVPPRNHRQLFRGLRIADQSEVGLIGQQRFVDLLRTQVIHVKLRVREAAREFFLESRHFRESDRIDGRHAHAAFHAGLQLVHCSLKLLFPPQDVAAKVEIELANRRESERPRRTVQQRYAQFLLQLVNVLAGSRLANPVLESPSTNTLELRYVPEKFTVIE